MRKKDRKSGSGSSGKRERRIRRKEKREAERVMPLSFPLLDLVASARESVDRLIVDVGLEVMKCILEDEVSQYAGERYVRDPEGEAFRWGREAGYVVLCAQKVPLDRPRVRRKDGREIALERYRLFQGGFRPPAGGGEEGPGPGLHPELRGGDRHDLGRLGGQEELGEPPREGSER